MLANTFGKLENMHSTHATENNGPGSITQTPDGQMSPRLLKDLVMVQIFFEAAKNSFNHNNTLNRNTKNKSIVNNPKMLTNNST